MPPVFKTNDNQVVGVVGRRVIEDPASIDQKFVLISAYGKKDQQAKVNNPALVDALYLCFDDIDETTGDYIAMSEEHAKKIADFVEQYKDFPTIICQCEAGVSRSGAMAAAIVWFLTGDDNEVWSNRFLHINRHVYRLLVNEFLSRGCKHSPDFSKKSPAIFIDNELF